MLNLKKQTIILTIGSIVLMGFQWLISVVLVRVSGYEDAGIFSLAMSISNVISTFANFGLRSLLITDYEHSFLNKQYIFGRMVTSFVSLLIGSVYVLFAFGYTPTERLSIILYLLYNLALMISDILMAAMQVKGHLEINGYSNIIRGILSFLTFVIAILISGKVLIALLFMALSSIAVLMIFDVPQYKKYCTTEGTNAKGTFKDSLKLIKRGFPIMLSLIVPVTITAIPRVAIRQLLSSEMLGYFASVFTPSVLLSTMIPPILTAGVPSISRKWNERHYSELKRTIFFNYGIVLLIVIIALILAAVAGRFFLRLLFGEGILQYYNLLFYAILSIGLSCVCVCGNNIIIAIGGRKYLIVFSGIALALTVGFSTLMVEKFNIFGAAYVQILAYSVQAIVQGVHIIVLIFKTERIKQR